jgi:hypothetical protein
MIKFNHPIIEQLKSKYYQHKLFTRFLNRNDKNVVKPFVAALNRQKSTVYFNQHIFMVSDDELKTFLINNGFSEYHPLKKDFLKIEFEQFYNVEFNINIILIPNNLKEKIMMAIDLCDLVTHDIGSNSDRVLTSFIKRIVGD